MKSALAGFLAALAACTPTPVPAPVAASRVPAEVPTLLGAHESLFRHQIALAAPPTSQYAAICISTEGTRPASDPSPKILTRLSDIKPPVEPWSNCRWSDEQPIESATGKPAIQISHSIHCDAIGHCAGTGGYAVGSMNAAQFSYSMTWENGQWVIQSLITAVS